MKSKQRGRGPRYGLLSAAAVVLLAASGPAAADMAAAEKWVNEEFQPSTLSKAEQMKEMEWFIKAAAPFKGMAIKVVSETIPTHEYESKVLTKAFEEITGIKVTHDLIQEGDVIEKLQIQMQSGENVFDAYINDSDLIGTHFRYGHAVALSDFMSGLMYQPLPFCGLASPPQTSRAPSSRPLSARSMVCSMTVSILSMRASQSS